MAVWQTWLAAVDDHEGRRPALGLRIAEGVRAQHFGVVGYAALACANLGEALQRMERFHASVYDANPAHLSVHGDTVCIEWGVARGRPGALVDETGLASLVQLSRDLVGKHIPAREVWFVNETPADLAPYRQFFGGEVRFDMPCTRLVLDAAWLGGGRILVLEPRRLAARAAAERMAASMVGGCTVAGVRTPSKARRPAPSGGAAPGP